MPKAYRPITLFKILLKGMERAINWLLGEMVVVLALPIQHTYTRGLGTETALFSFSDPVESVFHRGYLTACRKLHFIIPTFLVQPGTNEKTALLFLKFWLCSSASLSHRAKVDLKWTINVNKTY